jgi:hypothetical protein
MDARILTALAAAPEGLTVRQLTATLKQFYPEDKDLKSTINSLLYSVLEKTKRVQKHEPAVGTQAPVWRVTVEPPVTFVDLATTRADEIAVLKGDRNARWYGPPSFANAPAGAVLTDGYSFKLAMALAEERCAGRTVKVVSTNPELKTLA